MKANIVFAALIAFPCGIAAQTDTTHVPEAELQQLNVNMTSGNGLSVEMIDGDTVTDKGTFSIDTKYKRITITTVPKPWASSSDSIAEVLKDRRTERRNRFTYWSGIDLGMNTLVDESGSTNLGGDAEFMEIDNSRSRFFAINFMEQKIEFGSHHVGLVTGLGWEFTNYHLINNVLLQYNADSVYGVPVESPEFSKNKLRQTGFRLPVMLEFNTKRAPLPTEADIRAMRLDSTGTLAKKFDQTRKGNFHIALGVVGTWYYETMYKQKYKLEGEPRKDRSSGDYQMLPYRAAATVRIGYGGLNLFAEYSLTSFFKDGKGPELTPINIGLTIIGFN